MSISIELQMEIRLKIMQFITNEGYISVCFGIILSLYALNKELLFSYFHHLYSFY